MTVDMVAINMRVDFRDVEIGIFGSLAAFYDEWRTHQREAIIMRFEIGLDAPGEIGLGVGKGLIEDDQSFVRKLALIGMQGIFQNQVDGIENALREVNPQFVVDLNRSLDLGHKYYSDRLDGPNRDFIEAAQI
jgi:hypothetical protein